MSDTSVDVYKSLIRSFVEAELSSTDDALVFYQGFPGCFYRALTELGFERFADSPVVPETSYIDYSHIEPRKVLQRFITSAGRRWGYYEEFIALTDTQVDLGLYSGRIMIVPNDLFSVDYPIPVPAELPDAVRAFDEEHRDEDGGLTKYYADAKLIGGVGFFSYLNRHVSLDLTSQTREVGFYSSLKELPLSTSGSLESRSSLSEVEVLKADLQEGRLADCTYCVPSHKDTAVAHALSVMGSQYGVTFKEENPDRADSADTEFSHIGILRQYWGEQASYRDLRFYTSPATTAETTLLSQGTILSAIIAQCEVARASGSYSDVIITAPTGAGKSLFFQVPAIYLHTHHSAITLVITPLIALMKDQVAELERRKVPFATYINSEVTYEERLERLAGIRAGRYSIVYLSPELLLGSDIRNFTGEREIGLIAVDEAHLVTSWGRDFRVDYWFLGDYIEKLRRGSYDHGKRSRSGGLDFPVLCLTATAVNGGRDDVLGDLQDSLQLSCSPAHIYLGYVRRDNIGFSLQRLGPGHGLSKEQKVQLTCTRIGEFLDQRMKTIVYFPYVSQLNDVHGSVPGTAKQHVERYSGSGMDKFEKDASYVRFRDSRLSIMLATKAFGLGVNIPDIAVVYHFAPTGTLADYIQEIGRAARTLPHGIAAADYRRNDVHYAATLWGLSGLRHYQIRSIMRKLYDLYLVKQSRNMLISPDVFGYLFDANSVDSKVKSALMLLSADLLAKFRFRVLIVRPKNIFTRHYIHVPEGVEPVFLAKFGPYCELMTDDKPRVIPAISYQGNSEITVRNSNKVYEIDLGRVWEQEFADKTFAQFKYRFFTGDLFEMGGDKITPRHKLVIHYKTQYILAREQMSKVVDALQQTFHVLHRRFGGREFSLEDFRVLFSENYDSSLAREYFPMLLGTFCYQSAWFEDMPVEQWKCITKVNDGQANSGQFAESKYCFRTSRYGYIAGNLKRYLDQCVPNDDSDRTFTAYLTIPKKDAKFSEYQLVASLFELFGMATYEMMGGRNPQVFVRINDPLTLRRLAESPRPYLNGPLTDIENRHKRATVIVDRFMRADMGDVDRWNLIESYFLGRDDLVDAQLGIEW
jgi:ATP-dependent DNA helicase RecQ